MGLGFSGLTAGLSSGRGDSFAVEPAAGAATWTLANTDTPDPVSAGANVTNAIQLTVTSGGDVVSIVGTLVIDATSTFVSMTGTGWTLSRVGQTITASIDMLPSGLAPVITVVSTTPSGASTTVTLNASFVAANAATVTTNATTTVNGPIAGVDRDATNSIYFPSSAGQYTTFLAAVPGGVHGNPGNLYLLQGSGNATDQIGSCTLTNTFGTTGAAITGASRVGYKDADGGNSKKLVGTTGAPNPRTTSTLVGGYFDFAAAPASTRDLFGVQTGANIYYLSNGKLRIVASGNTDSVQTYNGFQGFAWMLTNITTSAITLYTAKEKLSGVFVLPNNGSALWVGGHTALCSAAVIGYFVEYSGAAAELTDGEMRNLISTHGETVLW